MGEPTLDQCREVSLKDHPQAKVGSNVSVCAEKFISTGRFTLGDNVSIRARTVILGDGAIIERDIRVHALRSEMALFQMGDESLLGYGTQVLCPEFVMGDYSQLHNHSLASGYRPLRIGHNCWIGQQTILNSTEDLTLGNNVRIGTQSQLWTHVASGELLEGCTLFGQKPLVLEDNVWLVGGVVVSPGLTLGRNSIVMVGSVVTKSTEAFHTYAGVPAQDITSKINAWVPKTQDEKFEMLRGYGAEFLEQNPVFQGRILFLDMESNDSRECFNREVAQPDLVVVVKTLGSEHAAAAAAWNASVFDLETKTYHKRRSEIEKAWIKFLVGFRARFIPSSSEDIHG